MAYSWYGSSIKNCFSKPPPVVYKRPPNLCNLLVRADLPRLSPSHFLSSVPSGNYPYGHHQQWHFTHKTDSFNHPYRGRKYNIKSHIHAQMPTCPHGYNWKTTRSLKTCTAEHCSNIINNITFRPEAVHFFKAKHNTSLWDLWEFCKHGLWVFKMATLYLSELWGRTLRSKCHKSNKMI